MLITAQQGAILSPIITYWVVAGFYEFLDAFALFERYRIRAEASMASEKANLVSRQQVFRHVILSQAVQTGILLVATSWLAANDTASLPESCPQAIALAMTFLPDSLRFSAAGSCLTLSKVVYLLWRQFAALVVLDTWVFWGHYAEHKNTWLYRNIHSVHHQLYVPFTFGALYNHWFESLCVDGMGGVLAVLIVGLSDQEAIWFYAFVTAKTVEDHCAYKLPWSPFVLFSRLTGADIVYHNIHHERRGLKTNFQIYFTWWDRLLGTDYKGPTKLGERISYKEKGEITNRTKSD